MIEGVCDQCGCYGENVLKVYGHMARQDKIHEEECVRANLAAGHFPADASLAFIKADDTLHWAKQNYFAAEVAIKEQEKYIEEIQQQLEKVYNKEDTEENLIEAKRELDKLEASFAQTEEVNLEIAEQEYNFQQEEYLSRIRMCRFVLLHRDCFSQFWKEWGEPDGSKAPKIPETIDEICLTNYGLALFWYPDEEVSPDEVEEILYRIDQECERYL